MLLHCVLRECLGRLFELMIRGCCGFEMEIVVTVEDFFRVWGVETSSCVTIGR
jgi:hypothetical protein